MKAVSLPLLLSLLVLAGCRHDPNQTERSYAGSPGSAYDAAANPAKAQGAATYDPASALAPHDYGNGGSPPPVR